MRNTRAQSHNAESSNTNHEAEAGRTHPTNGGDFMSQFLSALQGFVQQQAQTQATQTDLNRTSNTIDQAVERFRNYNPPRFNGRDGPLAAEEWLEELERIFTHINCSDEQKVSCAVFQLKEDARQWWKHFYRLLGEEDRNVLNWKIFKEVVMNKYFPLSFREKKETEFFELKQGNMTIEEYERKFNELARFAPHLVDTEDKMIARFRKGLRIDIKGIMAAHVIDDFSDLVKRAEEVGTALGTNHPTSKSTNQPIKRRWENPNQSGGNFQDKRSKFGGNTSANTQVTKPQCQKCGKFHNGECLWGKGVCFFCHEPGHTSSTCPKNKRNVLEGRMNVGLNKGSGKEPERKGNARFFSLKQQEEVEDDNTMTGTLIISGTPAVVLFDSGASHSFISLKFCQKNKIIWEVENLDLNISIPSGESIKTNRIARKISLKF
ncbi:uncharacterized protein LOC130998371 [Salvia miltiorrhiza]|uniref:uncharacterized protein LOC130998370 n=1 Tax=Salvia miltiorrhiza TaxID=226208 RepID=UPI0025AC78E9|nr:uncharacterized protein LOC130998370 [Salvia miltiorrhiza]XP_057779775.1 uncharacterized protein LOC130998371 [Salvia miltiorrhiza]